jgi:hypothetical protein
MYRMRIKASCCHVQVGTSKAWNADTEQKEGIMNELWELYI